MRIRNRLLSLLLISFLSTPNVSYASELRLVIPQFPPYTSEEDNVFSGIGIDLIEVLMQDVGVDYTLRSTPNYARALEEIIRGQADGFFLASENAQRNEVAVLSKPLLVNHWSWFFAPGNSLRPTSKDFKATAKVASLHGSNTNKWLIEHNYHVTTKPNSAVQFPILLLEKKRIDSVFLASVVFRKELELQGYSTDDYVEIEEISKPFGIYISKIYIRENPDFLIRLNMAIIKIQKLN